MTYPNTPGETLSVVGGWTHPTELHTMATIYRITAPGRPERYEARVYRAGRELEPVTAPTRDGLMVKLEQRYGGTA